MHNRGGFETRPYCQKIHARKRKTIQINPILFLIIFYFYIFFYLTSQTFYRILVDL
jgi:hypothetical protein